MALSKALNLKKLYQITSNKGTLVDFLRLHNVLFAFDGKCDRCSDGYVHLVQDSSAADGLKWRVLIDVVTAK